MRRGSKLLLVALLSVGVPAAPSVAQLPPADDPETAAPGELREAMREYFRSRLRRELALSDGQTTEIMPRIERLEQSRAAARRERVEAFRLLRTGLERGASDVELQGRLDRLAEVERREREDEVAILSEIDAALSVRQRAELRMFLPRFRREILDRVRELRGPGASPDRNGVRGGPRRPGPPGR